jgi:hypothetical protein
MSKGHKNADFQNLPACAAEFIKLVIKKMRYRRKVRQDVQAELAVHFEDELKDCASDEEKEQKAQKLIAEFGEPKLLAVLMRRAKKRCRPIWKKVLVRGLQVFGVIFLYLLICSSPLIIGRPTIKVNYVDWLNKFVQAGKDERDNARKYYEQAAALYVKMPQGLSAKPPKLPEDLNDVELNILPGWLQDSKGAIEVLRQGSLCPAYWNKYQGDETELSKGLMANTMEILPSYRHMAFAMLWQIRYELYKGDIKRALQDCVFLQRFGGHLYGQGLLIEQLVGVAIEALAHGEISSILKNTDVPADVLRFLHNELEKPFKKQELIISLKAEKVLWYDLIQRTFTDDGQGDGRVLKQGLPYVVQDSKDFFWRLLTFRYPSRQEFVAKIDEYFEQVDQLFEETPWDLHNKDADVDEWDQIFEQSSLMMLRIVGPAYEMLSQIAWRTETHRIALLALLAIMRHDKDKGLYPAGLDELVAAGYLKKPPMDPYSDGPLVYKRTDDGFLLYSFGTNLRDDGGRFGQGKDGKPRMWADDGDWVFWPVLNSEVNK